MYKKCRYCGRFYQRSKDEKTCIECDNQFKSIASQISKRYGDGLKNLKDR